MRPLTHRNAVQGLGTKLKEAADPAARWGISVLLTEEDGRLRDAEMATRSGLQRPFDHVDRYDSGR
jgi:hypothetical protein